jgi:hypothetical protein
MQKCLLTLIVSAVILCATGWSDSQAGGIRPGWYAHSQLVYGNAYERYAAGCLQWQFQNRSWYNTCVGTRERVVTAKY